MDELDWLSCNDPTPMLQFLQDRQVSERKLRLLSCACCRRIWDLLPDPRSRAAVEVAERYADGAATPRELARARAYALVAAGDGPAWAAYWVANVKASGPLWNTFTAAAAGPARQAAQSARQQNRAASWEAAQDLSQRTQVSLIREVIGDPFRDYPVAPLLRIWDSGIIVQLAESIYEEQAFDRMPILGDALEEAGCDYQVILDHCRSDNEHIRGCWVLDWILGRE